MSKGFTFIELLVASLIIMVFCLFLSGLTVTLQRNMNSADLYLRSALSSSSVMEDIKGKSYGELAALDGYLFDEGKGRIYVGQRGPDIYEIYVEHDWQVNRKPIRLYTLRSRY